MAEMMMNQRKEPTRKGGSFPYIRERAWARSPEGCPLPGTRHRIYFALAAAFFRAAR